MNLKFLKTVSCLLLLTLVIHSGFPQSKNFTLSGYVKEKSSNETLPGVTLLFPLQQAGTTTNTYGFYSITLPRGSYAFEISYVGYKTLSETIQLNEDTSLDFKLEVESLLLNEIEIVEEREVITEVTQMSRIKIPAWQVQEIPTLLGEKDVLKTLQLLPGIQSGNEGSSNLYVRGGGSDQNLLILDDAIVYNSGHLFGFISIFNGDAIKNIELYKGGFPARYGGRLSSIVDLQMKEGNQNEFHGKAGIGLVASNLTLEGPITKGKSSFLVSGRRSYIDLLVTPLLPKNEKGGYNFYDFNAKMNFHLNSNNKIYVSGYFGRDKLWLKTYNQKDTTRSDYDLGWRNQTATLRWNHLFNPKLFVNNSFVFSNFKFDVNQEEWHKEDYYSLNYYSGIKDLAFKSDFDYFPSPRHSVKFGVNAINHSFFPKALVLEDSLAQDFINEVISINSHELAVYLEDDFEISPRISVQAGFRLGTFILKEKSFVNPEPRLSVAYRFNNSITAKSSFARMHQNIHLLTNSGVGLPTDLWVPSTQAVRPQRADQFAIGLAKSLGKASVEISVEGFYKEMDNIINYKEGASFLDIGDSKSVQEFSYADKIVTGKGKAGGVEFFVQKVNGRLTGWAGYTLSWVKLKFDSLNYGKSFYPKYDRRHDLSLVGIYQLKKNITLSSTFVYGSGQAFTIANYQHSSLLPAFTEGSVAGMRSRHTNSFEEKSNFRGESYHRLDVGIQFKKEKKFGKRTWEFGIYNLYNRKNPYFYKIQFIENESSPIQGKRLRKISVFPLIPSINYKYEF